ncbi:hypothetical protein EAI90_10320 [Faecalibacterium prausnitzii]|nr:hypothetical protein [Faecalibacterium prausnitzii]MCI3202939.1 hypothetical protein [Faecalibacterium prausnitzii]RYS93904.1 hypothetical protein EAI90_10320 [Faecalibacterium prausnitzii]
MRSGHFQRKMILNFGISERLRAFRYPIFTTEFLANKKNRTRGHGYGSHYAGIRRSLPRSSCRPPASA